MRRRSSPRSTRSAGRSNTAAMAATIRATTTSTTSPTAICTMARPSPAQNPSSTCSAASMSTGIDVVGLWAGRPLRRRDQLPAVPARACSALHPAQLAAGGLAGSLRFGEHALGHPLLLHSAPVSRCGLRLGARRDGFGRRPHRTRPRSVSSRPGDAAADLTERPTRTPPRSRRSGHRHRPRPRPAARGPSRQSPRSAGGCRRDFARRRPAGRMGPVRSAPTLVSVASARSSSASSARPEPSTSPTAVLASASTTAVGRRGRVQGGPVGLGGGVHGG